MALSDLQVGGSWFQMVTSIELHVGVVNIATQIRHGGPDLALQHGHLDGLREHRRAVQAGCSSNFTKMPLLLFISLRVVPIDTVVALRQSFTSIWVASTSSCLLNNQRCAAVSLRLGHVLAALSMATNSPAGSHRALP